MTKEVFENEIKKMINDGKCDIEVNGYISFTFSRIVALKLKCFAVLNCDEIKFDNVGIEFISLYRHGVYYGVVDVKDVEDIYMI